MIDRTKFIEMAEKRMAQFDDCLRRIEPLARNYDHTREDVVEMIQYMRQGISKLESLFLSGGKIGGFRLNMDAGEPDQITDNTSDPTPIRKVQ